MAGCAWSMFFFQAEDGIRDLTVTGVQTCALPILAIALSGGRVGLVVAALIVFGVDAIPTEGNEAMQYILNPRLSWPIALICVGILIGVGLLAGILPARRAAAVDPVESLRYE